MKEVVADLRDGRSQRWLGVGMIPAPKRVVRRVGRSGLLVTTAVPGTAAAAVGFEGVLLTALNGEALDGTIAGYCRATEGLESGDTVDAEAIVKPGGAPRALHARDGLSRARRAGTMRAVSEELATAAEEEYLQTIYWLEEAGLPITGANIARAMQLSAPTVHEMVGRLEADGYVSRQEDKSLAFTASGRDHAAQIVRRHRLIERFLTDVLGIPWDEVHEEAERLEHAMSPTLEERMLAAIGDATTCPHGHPIVEGAREPGVPLADVEEGASASHPQVRERGGGPAPLPEGGRAPPRPRGHARRGRRRRGRDRVERLAPRRHPERGRDRVGHRRAVAAAARGAAGAAGARKGAIWPVRRR